MGLLDAAKTALDTGLEMASDACESASRAASGLCVERSSFMTRLAELCSKGFAMGWHEANGGNVSYRLAQADIDSSRGAFAQDASWVDLGASCPEMDGEFLAVTATGSYLEYVEKSIAASCGIVEIGQRGRAYRVVWGFSGGGRPTSELASHVLIHAVRKKATAGKSRILYHAHPANVVALTMVAKPSAKKVTKALWKSMTECIMLFPQGVGYVPWMVPGSTKIAQATAEQMETYDAVIWAHHGLFTSGASFEEVFGLAHTIDKAAGIYLAARAANGGNDSFASTISDANLIEMCDALALDARRDWLAG